MWKGIKKKTLQLRLLFVRFLRITKVMTTRSDVILYTFLIVLWVIFAFLTNRVSMIYEKALSHQSVDIRADALNCK